MPVSALMTKAVITCSPDDNLGIVASTMLSRNVRHLPVEPKQESPRVLKLRQMCRSTPFTKHFMSDPEQTNPIMPWI